LADHMALSVFPIDQVSADPNDEPPSDRPICPRAPSCFNPTIDDPAGWCCDCMKHMMDTCGGVDQACFRRNMCAHTKVSKAWKEQNDPSSRLRMGALSARAPWSRKEILQTCYKIALAVLQASRKQKKVTLTRRSRTSVVQVLDERQPMLRNQPSCAICLVFFF